MNIGIEKRRISLAIDMVVFTFVGCDNTSSNVYGHIGFTNYFINSNSSVSYIDHDCSNTNTHDYAIIIGR